MKLDTWSEKTKSCLVDLLFEMSRALGYSFDKVLLKKGAYTPRRFGDIDLQLDLLRRGMLDILFGHKGLPIIPFEYKQEGSD